MVACVGERLLSSSEAPYLHLVSIVSSGDELAIGRPAYYVNVLFLLKAISFTMDS